MIRRKDQAAGEARKRGKERIMENTQQILDAVREHYRKAAVQGGSGCGCGPAVAGGDSCCAPSMDVASAAMGYLSSDLKDIPSGANLGLGCGVPLEVAALQLGETVLDLGSGAGIDCFLAAKRVGTTGRVIGVDMTHEMLAKARQNAAEGGFANVEFRLGQIEALPLGDATVDVVISNCVVNLSPDKAAVFREVARVLKPGGRVAISDVVLTAELPPHVKGNLALYSACASGAASITELTAWMRSAGLTDVRVEPKDASRELIKTWAPGASLERYIVSANITARK